MTQKPCLDTDALTVHPALKEFFGYCLVKSALKLRGMMDSELSRFGLIAVTIIHRYGRLSPGEPIVQVMTLAPHREAAFRGAEFLMDYLKTDAPFWKQETGPNGTHWVEAKPEDDAARARWA